MSVKVAAVIGLVVAFPMAVLFWNGNPNVGQSERPKHDSASQEMSVDLDGAADQTIRKIAEIDAKISATKGELLRHEEERRKMASELTRIQTRISEVLDRKQAANR